MAGKSNKHNPGPVDSYGWSRLAFFPSEGNFQWDGRWLFNDGNDPMNLKSKVIKALSDYDEPERFIPDGKFDDNLKKTIGYERTAYFLAFWLNQYLTTVENRIWSYMQKLEPNTKKADKMYASFETKFREYFL